MSSEVNGDEGRPLVLYAQVETLIREEIVREGLQPGARLPTEADLCKRFKVSRSTIRQSLNRLEMDGLITRTRGKGTFVRRSGAAKSVSLTLQNPHHERSASSFHKMLGLVFCARSDTLAMNILLGAERAAKSRGYTIMFGYTGEDARAEEHEIQRLMRTGADGFIVMPVSNLAHTPGVQTIVDQKVPLILVDRYLSDIDTSYVISNGFDGAYRVTEHLIILGYESFIFITSGREDIGTTSVRDRYNGYCKALNDYGLGEYIKPLLPVNLLDQDQVARLISARDVDQRLPNAFVAVHDAVAMDFSRIAASVGLLAPDQFAIVGFDDLPAASHLNVPLTTVAQPRYDMGFHSGHLLIDHIEGRVTENEKLVLPVSVVVRESCGVRRIIADHLNGSKRRERSNVPI